MDDLITFGLIAVLLVEGVLAIISGAYIAYVYSQRKEDSAYLARLVRRDWRVAAGAVPIVLLVVYSLLMYAKPEWHLDPFPRPWGAICIGVPVALFLFGVIDDAVQFYRDRRIGARQRDAAGNYMPRDTE